MHIRSLLTALFFTAVLLAACSDATGDRSPKAAPPIADDYIIGPDDVIEIVVWKNEDVSRTVPVRPDGRISLPLVNDIQAAGLTPMQLRNDLKQRLTKYIPDPELSVIVREVKSSKVSVYGEVTHPGRFDLTGPTRVLDILAHAGGLSEFASKGGIVVLRNDNGSVERIEVDYDDLIDNGTNKNLYLRNGDIVVVP